ncbi:MAG: serine hydrolase domain-containing protein [Clostridium sp.]|nr:serine hydrolase domain-containing protein [Clostridium sp.]
MDCKEEKEIGYRLRSLMEEEIKKEHFAGALIGYYEKGREVFLDTYGMADREEARPVRRDTIFRLYSMSKPVAAVAVMILAERGLLDLDAPVCRYLPEYERMYVLGDETPYTITVRQLLNMTAGIVYPDEDAAGQEMTGLFEDIHAHIRDGAGYSTREVVKKIAEKPLANVPGSAWRYGLCADVLGAVIEVVSGMTLGAFYKKEIFEPLGMADTGFYVPREKWGRLAQLYRQEETENGVKLAVEEERTLGLTKCLEQPAFESAGAGLLSTADDSARFCMMLANQGILDGVRILKAETVEQFMQNQLGETQTESIYFEHMKGYGYGNLMRVLLDENASPIGGKQGEFGWDGWAGAYMAVDAKKQTVFLFMVQVSAYSNWPLNRAIREILCS